VYISAEDPALANADREATEPTEQTATTGVARVEDWGPILTDQLPRFLAHSKVIENLGPLSRKAHRAKTHGKWKPQQTAPGIFSLDLTARLPLRGDPFGNHPSVREPQVLETA
jgi:hypothetical protein